jgi:glc operon protein GlcG
MTGPLYEGNVEAASWARYLAFADADLTILRQAKAELTLTLSIAKKQEANVRVSHAVCVALGVFVTVGSLRAQVVVGPTLAEARRAIAASQAAASKMGVAISCVVVDARGSVIASERMDKALAVTIDVARGKAVTSAAFGVASGNLTGLAPSGIGNMLPGGPGLLMQGAVPIRRSNDNFGAVGCSGGTSQQDEDAAKAGVTAISS